MISATGTVLDVFYDITKHSTNVWGYVSATCFKTFQENSKPHFSVLLWTCFTTSQMFPPRGFWRWGKNSRMEGFLKWVQFNAPLQFSLNWLYLILTAELNFVPGNWRPARICPVLAPGWSCPEPTNGLNDGCRTSVRNSEPLKTGNKTGNENRKEVLKWRYSMTIFRSYFLETNNLCFKKPN